MARLAGKRIGRSKGSKVETKKYKAASKKILLHFNKLGGSLTAQQTADICHISKSTLYGYLKKMCSDGLIDELEDGSYVRKIEENKEKSGENCGIV